MEHHNDSRIHILQEGNLQSLEEEKQTEPVHMDSVLNGTDVYNPGDDCSPGEYNPGEYGWWKW